MEVKLELDSLIKEFKKDFLQENNIDIESLTAHKFLNSPIKKLSWLNVGSKEPYSDLDISLLGDYTQLAVPLFNHKILERFSTEPGIAFDSNVYAEAFQININKDVFSTNIRNNFLDYIKSSEEALIENTDIQIDYNTYLEFQPNLYLKIHISPTIFLQGISNLYRIISMLVNKHWRTVL